MFISLIMIKYSNNVLISLRICSKSLYGLYMSLTQNFELANLFYVYYFNVCFNKYYYFYRSLELYKRRILPHLLKPTMFFGIRLSNDNNFLSLVSERENTHKNISLLIIIRKCKFSH